MKIYLVLDIYKINCYAVHCTYPLMIKSDQNPDPLLRFLDVFCFILCMLHVPILLSVLYSVKTVLFKYMNWKFYIYACGDFDFVCLLSKHKTTHLKINNRHSHIKTKLYMAKNDIIK